MGLKCSVLGHKYGETTVEREREEQGSEVVITIQERETCERCGNTRIVSENKEVTAIETPSDIASDLVEDESESESETAATESPPEDEPTAGTVEPTNEGTERSDGWDSVDDPVETPDNAGIGDDSVDDGEPVDPSADDAEIIDDSDDEEEESGDVELDEPTTTVDVPDAEGEEPVTEDETDPEKDDGLILGEEEESESTGDDRQPGEWPEEPGDDGDDWSPETMPVDTGTEDSSSVKPTSDSAVTVPEGEFACPECGFTTEVESTSLREGDFCPECHKGSLVTRGE
jgi:ssDNA-binding Zn-finger/Zn-ribbon topoisomerase 1